MKKTIIIGAAALMLVACSEDEQTNETSDQAEEVEIEEPAEEMSWNDKVAEIASSDGSETAKFDEVSSYANSYEASEEEIQQFSDDIINEYVEGNYLSDISNHEYMLANIFKSHVVDKHYDDAEGAAIDSFAFDFLQNTKYNYRGADTPDSEDTLTNEEQMDKALEEIQS